MDYGDYLDASSVISFEESCSFPLVTVLQSHIYSNGVYYSQYCGQQDLIDPSNLDLVPEIVIYIHFLPNSPHYHKSWNLKHPKLVIYYETKRTSYQISIFSSRHSLKLNRKDGDAS